MSFISISDLYHAIEQHPEHGDFTLAICPGKSYQSQNHNYLRKGVQIMTNYAYFYFKKGRQITNLKLIFTPQKASATTASLSTSEGLSTMLSSTVIG